MIQKTKPEGAGQLLSSCWIGVCKTNYCFEYHLEEDEVHLNGLNGVALGGGCSVIQNKFLEYNSELQLTTTAIFKRTSSRTVWLSSIIEPAVPVLDLKVNLILYTVFYFFCFFRTTTSTSFGSIGFTFFCHFSIKG